MYSILDRKKGCIASPFFALGMNTTSVLPHVSPKSENNTSKSKQLEDNAGTHIHVHYKLKFSGVMWSSRSPIATYYLLLFYHPC